MKIFNNIDTINWFIINEKGFVVSKNNLFYLFRDIYEVYIYQLVLDESKYYIDSSSNIMARLENHRYCAKDSIKGGCPKFCSFVNKYDWNNFRLRILEYIDFTIIHT
jgi:hypothetical protein